MARGARRGNIGSSSAIAGFQPAESVGQGKYYAKSMSTSGCKTADVARAARALSAGPKLDSAWAGLPRDVLTKLAVHNSRLYCVLPQVCRAWRQHMLTHAHSVSVSLACEDDLFSLAKWLQSRQQAGTESQLNTHQTHNHLEQPQQRIQPSESESNAQPAQLGPVLIGQELNIAAVQHKSQQNCRHITTLNLSCWVNWLVQPTEYKTVLEKDLVLRNTFWEALGSAQVQELTLGELSSDDFISIVPYLTSTPSSESFSYRLLQSLTLHLSSLIVGDLFRHTKEVFANLQSLTSLTLRASEMLPSGQRKKHSIPADELQACTPTTLQSLTLHNFRDRWKCFQSLASMPSLVTLDLSQSSVILPEASAWTQLHSLKLEESLVWLAHELPFDFQALTQLTKLDLTLCHFGVHRPGVLGNTQSYRYKSFQAPTSIVELDISTRGIKVPANAYGVKQQHLASNGKFCMTE